MTPALESRIVIVGAGQAGGRAAEEFRSRGHRGPIQLVGAEPHEPYERPPLSKSVLLGEAEGVPHLLTSERWRELDVELLVGNAAVGCDLDRRTVGLKSGHELVFDKLLLSTGTQPRKLESLSSVDMPVHYLRTIDDAEALRSDLRPGRKVAIVGGGVIGLEVAAAAVTRGCQVEVVELADRLLPRAIPPAVSDALVESHRAKGVAFRFGVGVHSGDAGGIVLTDGQPLRADLLVVGIGVEPTTDLPSQIGVGNAAGIQVDASGMTAHPDVYAAGDVTLQWSPYHGQLLRVESWANAQDQATCTARNILGIDTPYSVLPWFWSDQGDLKLQVVGDANAEQQVVRGDPKDGRFTLFSLRGGELVGGVAFNNPRDMGALRRLVAAKAKLNSGDLENPQYDLRRALKALK